MNTVCHYKINKIHLSSTNKLQFELSNGMTVNSYNYEEIQQFVSTKFVLEWISRIFGTKQTKEELILSHVRRMALTGCLCHVYYKDEVLLACPWHMLTKIFPLWDNNDCHKEILDITEIVCTKIKTAPKWEPFRFAQIIHALLNNDLLEHVLNTNMNWQQIDNVIWWCEYFGTSIDCSFVQNMVSIFTDTCTMQQVVNKCASQSFKKSLQAAIRYRMLKKYEFEKNDNKESEQKSEKSVLNNEDEKHKKLIDNKLHVYYDNNPRLLGCDGCDNLQNYNEMRRLGENISQQMTPYLLLCLGEQLHEVFESNEEATYIHPVGLTLRMMISQVLDNHHAFIHNFVTNFKLDQNVLFHIIMIEINVLWYTDDKYHRQTLLKDAFKCLAMLCEKGIFAVSHIQIVIEVLYHHSNSRDGFMHKYILDIIDVNRSITMTNYSIVTNVLNFLFYRCKDNNGCAGWKSIISRLTLNETFDHCLCVRKWIKTNDVNIPDLIKWCDKQINA